MGSVRPPTPLFLLCLLAACERGGSGPQVLRLTGIRPEVGQGLFLNEELVLTFSEPVDPASITSTSLYVIASNGKRARGRWEALGRSLRFIPAPVLHPTLDDGGYLPGTDYTLVGRGFPRFDGLRGEGGRPLERGFRWSFRTVDAAGPAAGILFDDASPERAFPLRPDSSKLDPRVGMRLHPWEPIVLTCAEPIDPSTLPAARFELIAYEERSRREGDQIVRVTVPQAEPMKLSVVLRKNEPQGSCGAAPCSELELHPPAPLRPGVYDLLPMPGQGLTDFHGNLVPIPFSRLTVRVDAASASMESRCPTLAFLDDARRLPIPLPGTDGVAAWGGGRVSVRYPAAAGSGIDGPLGGSAFPAKPDLQGTSVVIPAGESLSLLPGGGLRILRAQRSLRVQGRLLRRRGAESSRIGPKEPGAPFLPGETLSEWLARAEDWDWTVLIAGGDLSLSGVVDVDTPLLLVAGGWIRISGEVHQTPHQLWGLGDGGGLGGLTVSPADLILDAPRINPLVEGLRVGVVSSPLPADIRAYEWTGLEVGGEDGSGRWSVMFLPARGPVDPKAAVGHPRLLPAGPLRVLILLDVPPAGDGIQPWDPPFVDYVDLRWTEPK